MNKSVLTAMFLAMAVMIVNVQANVYFSDDFGSAYDYDGDLSLPVESANWSTTFGQLNAKVGTWYDGYARVMNNHWAYEGYAFITAETEQLAGMSDYVVRATTDMDDSASYFYIGGRVAEGNYIALGAVVSGGQVWARYRDSSGVAVGDWYVADYVAGERIFMELALDGENVTGSIIHGDGSQDFSEITSVTGAGLPGMGAQFNWGFANARVYDFEVVPEPATLGLLGLGLGIIGYKRRK